MKPTSGKWLKDNGLKNVKIIIEVNSPPAEVSREEIHNRRIPLNDFPIFSKSYSLDDVVKFMGKCHVDFLLEASEVISHKKKRKTAKKHSEIMAKKFKTSIEHRETSTKAPGASKSTSARTYIPSNIHLITIVNSLFIPPPTITSSIPTTLPYNVPFVLELMPTFASQSNNPNVTIPPPSPSIYKLLTSTIIPPSQSYLPSFLLSQLIQPRNHPLDLEPFSSFTRCSYCRIKL